MKDTVENLNPKKSYGELASINPNHSKFCACRQICGSAKHLILVLLVGQVLAGLLGASAVCAAMLSRLGFNLPLTQNIPHYLILFVVFGTVRLCQRSLDPKPQTIISKGTRYKTRCWKAFYYAVAGCIDLHAFWATLAAYAYTNVTSIQLLDCLGIPTSILLSYFLLRYRYTWTHYVGAGICLFGAVMMIGADLLAAENQVTMLSVKPNATVNGTRTLVMFGDMLAVLGAILYGLSSVLQEHLIQNFGSVNYLAWFSIVAALFGAIYSLLLEHLKLNELLLKGSLGGQKIPMTALLYYFGYAFSMFALDSVTAFTIRRISAVFINLSLLTADIWGLLAGVWLFQVQFHYLYFVSFFLIIAGASIFAIRSAQTQSIA